MDELWAYSPDGRPLTVAAIIPHPDGLPEVLMSGRAGAADHAWFWIGGHVHEGEEAAGAALRELDEEVEVDDPQVVSLLGVVDLHADVSATWGAEFKRGYRVHYVLVAVGSSRVRVKDHEELTDVAWLPLDQVGAAVASLPAEVRDAAVRFARQAVGEPSVAACYIVRDGHLLMVRRRFKAGTLEWAGPSGNIHPGETPEHAAVRETMEEVGVVIEPLRVLGDRVHPASGRHLIYLACRYVSGEPRVVDHEEVADVEWVPIPEALERWSDLVGGVFPATRAYLEAEWAAHMAAGGKR